jgi:hypothetical protein
VTTWPKISIRTIALGNVAMGGFGLYLQIDGAIRFSQRHQFTSTRPYETYAFWVIVCIGFVFASLTLLSGFFLWRTGRPALRLCNWLFGSELVYWFGSSMLDVMLLTSKSEWAHRLGMSIGAVGGVGNVGLGPQVFSLYPVWVLLLLNLAYWRMGKAEPSTAKISV